LEEVARAAAEFAVREPFWETYVPEIETITAGAYWKLLAYYWDSEKAKRRTKRQKSPQLSWRNLEMRQSAPSTKPPSPTPSTASFPFDATSDGDVLLRSSDGVQFRVHRIILATSSHFFKDMFSLPQQPTLDGLEALSTVPFTEASDTLDSLLRAIYPVDEPDLKLVQDIERVMEAAIKYDVPKQAGRCGESSSRGILAPADTLLVRARVDGPTHLGLCGDSSGHPASAD